MNRLLVPVLVSLFFSVHSVADEDAHDLVFQPVLVEDTLQDSLAETTRLSNMALQAAFSGQIAVMTYVASNEHERLVRAMIKSLRELSGAYTSSKIYVVVADTAILPCRSLRAENVELLPLQTGNAYTEYPLAIKAFAASEVESLVKDNIATLVWFDPGVLVLGPPDDLDLDDSYDAALRAVTLRNNIGIAPGTKPDGYWMKIHEINKLDYRELVPVKTIVGQELVQPYFNCEVYSINPKLGLCRKWAEQLAVVLEDSVYQAAYCNSFPRQLFLHQAVFSAVIVSGVRQKRLRQLQLTSSYPFNQHEKLAADDKILSLNEINIIIFDNAWSGIPDWAGKIPSSDPLRAWLKKTYLEYRVTSGENPQDTPAKTI